MRTRFIIAAAILLPFLVHAQYKGKITGIIADSQHKQPLEGATVSVLDSASGIYIKHAVTNTRGEFTVTSLPLDTALQVIITYTGYRDTTAMVRITEKTKIKNIGTWKLIPGDELESVTVTARKAPFVVKKDTLEFNATAFKTLPTDMVQDLLQKLPGVAVDADGNVTVNGQKVDKIKVDGRDFFNPNIKTALENLPGAIIEKVQVTPGKPEAQANTSLIQPADRNLTINLQLKKQNKRGTFGHVGAGYGTQQLYQAEGFVNQFTPASRWSAIAKANKGNQGGYLGKGGNWGGNLNDKVGKTNVDVAYNGNVNETKGTSTLERQNILPDSSFLYNSISATNNRNVNHQLNAMLNTEIDSLQVLNVRPEFTYMQNNNDGDNSAMSTTMNGELINSQRNRQQNKSTTTGMNNTASYYRSSKDRRTAYSLTWNLRSEQTNGTTRNQSENTFSNHTDTIDQNGTTSGSRFGNNISVVINQRLYKRITAIAQYTLSQSNDRDTRKTYNADNKIDSTYSNDNRNTSLRHLPEISIGYGGEKVIVELGAGWTIRRQENKLLWKDTSIIIKQNSFTPRLSASWNFAKRSAVTMQYMVNNAPPAPEQLAPAADNSNPLYIIRGNPALQSTFTHNMNISVQYYSTDLRWFGSLRGAASINDKPIVSETFFDDSGRQVSTWRNAPTANAINLSAIVGRSIRVGEWNWQINGEAHVNNSEEPGYINGQLSNVRRLQTSPRINLNMNYSTQIFVNLQMALESNRTTYTLSKENNQQFDNKRIQLNCKWLLTKKIQINPSISYYYNAQLPASFQRSQTLLNAGIRYFMLSNSLAVGITINDILNNGVTTIRTVTPTAIETTQVNAIRRNGLITARYRLSKFGGGGYREN